MTDEGPKDDVKRQEVLNVMNTESKPRRNFMKKATGALTALPLISSASVAQEGSSEKNIHADIGKEQLRRNSNKYESVEASRKAFESHGMDVLEVLSTKGFIETPDVSSLDIEKPLTGRDIADVENGTILFSYISDAGPTSQIQILKSVKEGTLRIGVEPEIDRSFAFIEKDNTMESIYLSSCQDDVCTSCWEGGCYTNPNEDCGCTEDDPCGCWEVRVQCCYDCSQNSRCSCLIIDWSYGSCTSGPEGCCGDLPTCDEACSNSGCWPNEDHCSIQQ